MLTILGKSTKLKAAVSIGSAFFAVAGAGCGKHNVEPLLVLSPAKAVSPLTIAKRTEPTPDAVPDLKWATIFSKASSCVGKPQTALQAVVGKPGAILHPGTSHMTYLYDTGSGKLVVTFGAASESVPKVVSTYIKLEGTWTSGSGRLPNKNRKIFSAKAIWNKIGAAAKPASVYADDVKMADYWVYSPPTRQGMGFKSVLSGKTAFGSEISCREQPKRLLKKLEK